MQLTNNVSEAQKQKQSYANERKAGKEQFYTDSEIASRCVEYALSFFESRGVEISVVLEPCGGTGEFVEAIMSHKIEVISCDIEPKHQDVVYADFLDPTDDPIFKNGKKLSSYSGIVTITNPPFGRNHDMSIPFFRRCAEMSDYICYIIPKSWRKRSVINRLPQNYWLVADIELPSNSFYFPDGSKSDKGVLQTVFQIWEKRETPRPTIKEPDHGLLKKIQPVKGQVQIYRKDKRQFYVKEGGKFVEVEEDLFCKGEKQKRPLWVEGANFSIYYSGSTAGKCQRISSNIARANTASYYFDVKDEEVMKAIEEIDFKKLTGDNAYVESFSIDDINRELNKKFGLETQDLSWLEEVWQT